MPNRHDLGISIFISYAHEDLKFVEGLRKPLALIERNRNCRLTWYDIDIKAGEDWRKEIDSYLREANIAILLISSDFLYSDFIQEHELPVLLSRCSEGKITLLCLLLSEVDLEEAGLSHIQFVNPINHPLKKLSTYKRETYYQKLAERIKKMIDEPVPESEHLSSNDSEKFTLESSERELSDANDGTLPDALTWNINIPASCAPDEIDRQLHGFVTRTKMLGFITFTRGDYYVQCALYKELDPFAIVVEAVSNANLLPLNRTPLSRLQIRHLQEELQFTQPSPNENFMMIAAINSEDDLLDLRILIWHILNDVMNCTPESKLEVSGQCR